MSGYSGTPLPKKLGIKPGFRAYLVNVPPEVRSQLSSELAACTIAPNLKTRLDFAMLLATSRKQLTQNVMRSQEPWRLQACCGGLAEEVVQS